MDQESVSSIEGCLAEHGRAFVEKMNAHEGKRKDSSDAVVCEDGLPQVDSVDHLLEKSYQDTLSILSRLRMGIILTNEKREVIFANKLIGVLSGLSPEQMIGQSWADLELCSVKENKRIWEMADVAEDKRQKIDMNCTNRNGHHHHVEIDIQDDPRNSQGKILFFYDMTEVHDLRMMLEERWSFEDMVGKSKSMQNVFQQIRDIANLDLTVLIEGETGTGKEMVARAIHHCSDRSNNPFVAFNCAGLADSLLTSQLFGHRRGSFTGAISDHRGLFESANGGTLFLDEIGNIPLHVQTALLRVLQEREILRIGDSQPRGIDVRVLAAANCDLIREVKEGRFRQDLLFRIRVGRIHLPSLRKRRVDIPLLAMHFLGRCRSAMVKDISEISGEAMSKLMKYDWPGNVRELQNTIEFAMVQASQGQIHLADLPPEILQMKHSSDKTIVSEKSGFENKRRLSNALNQGKESDQEIRRFTQALEDSGGNRSKTAKILGISRATFYRRLSKMNM